MTVDVANPDLLSALTVVIKQYVAILIFYLQNYRCSLHKTGRFCDCWVKCLHSVWLIWVSWLRKGSAEYSFSYLLRNAWTKRLQIDKYCSPLRYLLDNFPASLGFYFFFCHVQTRQMSVILPQLSEAIMTICSALFLVSRSMFSHETLDPLNQSLLSRACGTCLNHNFMSSAATAIWVKYNREILKEWKEK